MVYVLDVNGQPLIPTSRHRKVRKLLNAKLAKIVKRYPFTIQLLYEPNTHITQPVSLGMDAGSKHICIAATTETKVLYAEELEPRNDVVKLLSMRRQNRKTRRSHKTRYRQVRHHNRQIHKNTIQKGGYRKLNQAPHAVKGFRLFDKVLFKNKKCFIFGRRSSGSFDVRMLNGTKISPCAGYKKLRILKTA